jgi:hypothetical protein
MEIIVYAKLPRAGLGNMLQVWAKGLVYARLNDAEFYHSGWNVLRIGPYLRRELKKRNYTYFKSSFGLFDFLQVLLKKIRYSKLENPDVCKQNISKNTYVVFNKLNPLGDRFMAIKDHREFIKTSLLSIISPDILRKFEETDGAFIGVHIRRGDFSEPDPTKPFDFSNCWNGRAPIDYFVSAIQQLRLFIGKSVKVLVFSDGFDAELKQVLDLENVVRANKQNEDILDILLLSKCKVILTSPASSFSYWAAFLSNAIVLRHQNFIRAGIRSQETNAQYYEGPLSDQMEDWPNLLKSNLKAISDD